MATRLLLSSFQPWSRRTRNSRKISGARGGASTGLACAPPSFRGERGGGGVEGVRVTIFSISSGALFTDGSDCRCASCNNTALKKGKKARSHFTLSAVVTTVWFASKGRAFFQSRLFIELTLPIQRANCSTTIRKLTQSHPVNHNESRRGRD